MFRGDGVVCGCAGARVRGCSERSVLRKKCASCALVPTRARGVRPRDDVRVVGRRKCGGGGVVASWRGASLAARRV